MSTEQFKLVLDEFAARLRHLQADFARVMDDLDAYEDEAACGYCGARGGNQTKTCEHCGASFCPGCWEKAIEFAAATQKTEAEP